MDICIFRRAFVFDGLTSGINDYEFMNVDLCPPLEPLNYFKSEDYNYHHLLSERVLLTVFCYWRRIICFPAEFYHPAHNARGHLVLF